MAAPVFDQTQGVGGNGVASLTTPAWTPTGTNRILVIDVGMSAGSPPTVTAVKWGGSGGTALTLLAASGIVQGFLRVERWYLLNPAASNLTAYASFSGNSDECVIIGHSYADVNQSTPWGTAAQANGSNSTSATPTVNASSATDELVTDFVYQLTGALTVGASQTQRKQQADPGLVVMAGTSTEPGATTTTMSWAHNGTVSNWEWAIIAAALKPLGAGGGSGIDPHLRSLAILAAVNRSANF